MTLPTIRATDALLAFVLLGIAWSFYRVQRDPGITFNMLDLLMENGRVSRTACVFMGSFAALTWIMIRLTVDGKMTEGYLTSYGAIFVAPIVAKMFATASPTTVTTVTATKTTTEPTP